MYVGFAPKAATVKSLYPAPGAPNGTLIEFESDLEIFGVVAYVDDLVQRRLRLYACLHAGLAIVYNGAEIVSENGLTDLILEEVGEEAVYGPLHHRSPALEIHGSAVRVWPWPAWTMSSGTQSAMRRAGAWRTRLARWRRA